MTREPGSLYPEIEPYAHRDARRSATATRSTARSAATPTASRSCSCTAGRAAAPTPRQRRFFDPGAYRIVLFDQRGCGRSSTPQRRRRSERQHHLAPGRRHRAAARAPRHRALAGVRRLVGQHARARLRARRTPSASPSWCCAASSCCAAASSTGSTTDGAGALFPDCWERLPRAARRARALAVTSSRAYHRLLTDPDPRCTGRPAWRGRTWEAATITLEPRPGRRSRRIAEPAVRARLRPHREPLLRARAACSSEGQLIADAHRLRRHPRRHRPGPLRPGHPDVTAWDLHRAWPRPSSWSCRDAGHALDEPGILDALIAATDRSSGWGAPGAG